MTLFLESLTKEVGYDDPDYDFELPETVIYEIDGSFAYILEVSSESGLCGSVSHENDHGCLGFQLEEMMIRKPYPGFYVVTDGTMSYTPGDGWYTDGDSELYCSDPRPAILSEIFQVGEKITWRIFWQQLKLHWLYSHGYEL